MQLTPLPRAFFARRARVVAPQLLGKILVHHTPDGPVAGRIVETEAYCGESDLACHASRGRTARTAVMYGPAGHAYLFLLYGMHWAFNVVVAWPDEPHAVLVRALEPVMGVETMAARRGLAPDNTRLTNGPGKLCAALGLHRAHNGADLCAPEAPLFIAQESGDARVRIGRSPRINVDYAGAWAARKWRFHVRGNRFVSVPPRD